VSLRDVLLYHEGRGEFEVVVFDNGAPVEVDGDPAGWRELAAAWEARKHEHLMAKLYP